MEEGERFRRVAILVAFRIVGAGRVVDRAGQRLTMHFHEGCGVAHMVIAVIARRVRRGRRAGPAAGAAMANPLAVARARISLFIDRVSRGN